jgi:hypothetical protein
MILSAKVSLLFVIFSFISASVHAQCTVPVCDIPAEIKVLRTQTENERFQYVSNLQKNYHHSTDATALANLREFGMEAANLFIEIHEEDWLVRAAKTLASESSVGLAKFQKPVKAETLIGFYKEVQTQEYRFAILSYWTSQIDTNEDAALLTELVNFASAARKISFADHEDEYMLRQADQILQKASARYTQLNPEHEGLYRVSITCRNDPRAQLSCSDLVMMTDRMTMIDTQSNNGLMVVFAATAVDTDAFEFALTSYTAEKIDATSRIIEKPGEMHATRDPVSGVIKGTLTTTRSLGINYDFVATPMRTARDFGKGAPMAANESIEGIYEGTWAGFKVQFIVNKFEDGTIRATLVQSDGENHIDFQSENSVLHRSLFAFVSHATTIRYGIHEMKMFLQKVKLRSGAIEWRGFYLVPQGRAVEVRLQKKV